MQDDQAKLAQAKVVIVILGMNQMEPSFADAQKQLMERLKAAAPKARYYWVDIGATIAPQAASWSERNRVIYANAPVLGYEVVSRYKAIFGPQADPLHIEGGKNFADWPTEDGYGGPGNVHGFYGRTGAGAHHRRGGRAGAQRSLQAQIWPERLRARRLHRLRAAARRLCRQAQGPARR